MPIGTKLYSRGSLREFLQKERERLEREAMSTPRDVILAIDIDTRAQELANSFLIDPPSIDLDAIAQDEPEDCSIRSIHGSAMDATRYTFHVPTSGNHHLFAYEPSTFAMNTLKQPAYALPGGLSLTYEILPTQIADLEHRLRSNLNQISKNIDNLRADVEQHNRHLVPCATEALQRRKRSVAQDEANVATLGIPIRRRQNPKVVAQVPLRRKPSPVPMSAPPKVDSPSTHELSIAVYDEILRVMDNMAQVMELSPAAFQSIKEDELRWHFLVQLNGQYEWTATGETFRSKGKTDVQVLIDDRAVFVAECKYWKGPSKFAAAIDQLLGYLVWRDTRAALLVFNRDTSPSTVLAGCSTAVEGHTAYIEPAPGDSPSRRRCWMRHPRDPDSRLLVTVLVYDLPTPDSVSEGA